MAATSANSKKALKQFLTMSQEEVDSIVKSMSEAGLEAQLTLARAAVDEADPRKPASSILWQIMN